MDQDTGEIRAEVGQAREQLGETVEALAQKVNAPRRMKEDTIAKARAAQQQAATTTDQLKRQATQRIQDTKQRISSDPRAHSATRVAGETVQPRLDHAAAVVKRHPTATAIAAIGLVTGILLGRITK